VPIALHPDVEVMVDVSVARNAEEAERIASGEDVTARRDEVAAAEVAADNFFEPEAAPRAEGEEEAEAPAKE